MYIEKKEATNYPKNKNYTSNDNLVKCLKFFLNTMHVNLNWQHSHNLISSASSHLFMSSTSN